MEVVHTNLPERIIVFDTEYTSWEGAQARNWSRPGEFREIVQIGAVLVDTKDCSEIASCLLYVLPRRNPKLSDYFIKLTGITQETVDANGTTFSEALKKFSEWIGDYQLYSWGNDGKNILENCQLENIPCPIDPSRFLDVRSIFSAAGIPVENYMSSTIIRAFGKESSRHGHDGLSDARSIVDGLRLLKEQAQLISS